MNLSIHRENWQPDSGLLHSLNGDGKNAISAAQRGRYVRILMTVKRTFADLANLIGFSAIHRVRNGLKRMMFRSGAEFRGHAAPIALFGSGQGMPMGTLALILFDKAREQRR